MQMLILSLLVLPLAPLFYVSIKRLGGGFHILDRIVFLLVAALVLLELLTHSIEEAGYWALIFFVLGWLLPSWLEKGWHSIAHKVHLAAVFIAFIALAIHGFMDGVVMAEKPSPVGEVNYLPWAIVLHNIPKSVFLWWLLYPRYGMMLPIFSYFLIGGSAVSGFFVGESFTGDLEAGFAVSAVKALVAGSLLHLAFHDKH